MRARRSSRHARSAWIVLWRFVVRSNDRSMPRGDAFFELGSAVLCADRPVTTPVDFRRPPKPPRSAQPLRRAGRRADRPGPAARAVTGLPVPRDRHDTAFCTVDRIMRDIGMNGVVRGRKQRTTIRAKDGIRAGDRLNRDFTAPAPNLSWVTDFT